MLHAAAGVVPAPVLGLVQGGMTAMLGIKLKAVGLSLGLAAVVATGAAGLAVRDSARTGDTGAAGTSATPSGDDGQAIRGKWTVFGLGDFGPGSNLPAMAQAMAERSDIVRISRETIDLAAGEIHARYRLDPSSRPGRIDLIDDENHVTPGIYELKGKTLRICLGISPNGGQPTRPLGFEESDLAPGAKAHLYVMARAQEGQEREQEEKARSEGIVATERRSSVESLARRLQQLQAEKSELQARLEKAMKDQNDAMVQAESAREAERESRAVALEARARAEAERDHAREVARRLQQDPAAATERVSSEQRLVESLLERGRAELNAGRLAEAERNLRQASESARRIIEEQPDAVVPRSRLALALQYLGVEKLQQGNTNESEALLQQANEITQTLVAKAPSNQDIREQFAICQKELAELYQRIGRLDQALAALERSRAVVEQLVRETPERTSSVAALAEVLEALGKVHESSGRGAEAERLRASVQAIRERLAQKSRNLPAPAHDGTVSPGNAAPPALSETREADQEALIQRLRAEIAELKAALAGAREDSARRFEQAKSSLELYYEQLYRAQQKAEETAGNTESAIRKGLEFVQRNQALSRGTTSPWHFQYETLPPGKMSESLSEFESRLGRAATEGWEFCGMADLELTSAELETLGKTDKASEAPGTNEGTSQVRRVYVFRSPAVEDRALKR
jgi:uncharacterized protein (TIGR03067 family)